MALKKPHLAAMKQTVKERILQESRSPEAVAAINRKVDFENNKIAKALKAGEKVVKKRKGKAAVTVAVAQEEKDVKPTTRKGKAVAEVEEPEVEQEVEEPEVGIITILLAFLIANVVAKLPVAKKGARKGAKTRAPRKKAHAMVLWADGPNITPVANFIGTRYIMQEYNAASDRGTMECGCPFCTNSVRKTLLVHDAHVRWHKKYRVYFQLRTDKFPTLKDMDATRIWPLADQMRILDELVQLWKQVDGQAVWFLSAGYLDQRASPKAKSAAAAASARKAVAISRWQMEADEID